MKCQVDAIQWGGGGGSRIFSWSPKPTHGGGGGSSRIFRGLQTRRDSVGGGGGGGGGVVAEFSVVFKSRRDSLGEGCTMEFSFMGPFYIITLSQRPSP